MLLKTITEIIENVLKNEDYKNTIYDYIKLLTNDEYLVLEEEMGITLTNFEMSEYLKVKIYGPEQVHIEMIYCDKKEKFTHKLDINIDQENNIYVSEIKNGLKDLILKEEEYKNNELFYWCEITQQLEENNVNLKEIVFNEENIAYACTKNINNNKIVSEEYNVGEISSAYTFTKEGNKEDYNGKIITPISRKQYLKATEYVLQSNTKKEEKKTKLKKFINIIKSKKN